MSSFSEIRLGTPSEREALGELHRRSSYVWEPDRVNLEAHPDALGVAPEALVEDAAARAGIDGYRELTVVAHPRNFAFYESLGFVGGEPVSTRFGPATRLRRGLGTDRA